MTRCRFCVGSTDDHVAGCPAVAKPELNNGPIPIDRTPLTKREIEMLIGCFRGHVIGTDHEAAPWAQRLLAKGRAMYVDAKSNPGDDDPGMPLFGDVVKYPVPKTMEAAPAKKRRSKRKAEGEK